jgi:hypothetical protein
MINGNLTVHGSKDPFPVFAVPHDMKVRSGDAIHRIRPAGQTRLRIACRSLNWAIWCIRPKSSMTIICWVNWMLRAQCWKAPNTTSRASEAFSAPAFHRKRVQLLYGLSDDYEYRETTQ